MVWWRCSTDPTHEWQANVNQRVRGKSGCPICARNLPQKKYPPLSDFDPELANQFIESRNPGLSPKSLSPASGKKVWWRCATNPSHEWAAIVRNRALQNRGCPFCGSQRPSDGKTLSDLAPLVAEEWHHEKNGDLKPSDVTLGSGKLVWWRCVSNPDHEWSAVVYSRTKRRFPNRCPFCSGSKLTSTNSLAECHPPVIITTNSSI